MLQRSEQSLYEQMDRLNQKQAESSSDPDDNGPKITLSESVLHDLRTYSVSLLSQMHSMKESLQTIMDTNSFMQMTVNRCIDYAKASKGIKLLPKLETIDLWETLELPLGRIRSVQDRIKVVLSNDRKQSDREICSHVITDKQWLQENLLCLLSNAVKYTVEGDVTLSVTVEYGENKKTLPPSKSFVTGRHRSRSKCAGNDMCHSNGKMSQASKRDCKGPFSLVSRFFRNVRVSPLNPSPSDGALHRLNAMIGWRVSGRRSHGSEASSSEESNKQLGLSNSSSSIFRTLHRSIRSAISGDGGISNKVRPMDSPRMTLIPLYLRFEVEDSGFGIPPEMITKLFRPFKQTQRLAGGTGLGLYSLAKRIEAIHGQYGVKTRKDGKSGSVFWFSIPYLPDESSSAINPSQDDCNSNTGNIVQNEIGSTLQSLQDRHCSLLKQSLILDSENTISISASAQSYSSEQQMSSKIAIALSKSLARSMSNSLTRPHVALAVQPLVTSLRSVNDRDSSCDQRTENEDHLHVIPCHLPLEIASTIVDSSSVPVNISKRDSSPDLPCPLTGDEDEFPPEEKSRSRYSSHSDSTGQQRSIHSGTTSISTNNVNTTINACKVLSRLNILVVDDSMAILKMVSLVLKKSSHKVITADNGLNAVKAVEEHWRDHGSVFDVILMDLQMPIMDGVEATKRLREMEKLSINEAGGSFPKQTIVGFSANSDYETTKVALNAGIDAFMTKPFKMETFTKIVFDLLSSSNSNSNSNHIRKK
jgi:CheY-like chemotaxis protein/signal transduction histidine kinase